MHVQRRWSGSSTSGAYIESAAGVREGARTGLAAVTTALLFAVALFFIPLVQPLQHLGYAYGPALIAVGVMMIGSVRKIDFDDPTEAVPAFVTLVMIVFTYNIANGLTAGLIVHPLLKVLAGRGRELNAGVGRARRWPAWCTTCSACRIRRSSLR